MPRLTDSSISPRTRARRRARLLSASRIRLRAIAAPGLRSFLPGVTSICYVGWNVERRFQNYRNGPRFRGARGDAPRRISPRLVTDHRVEENGMSGPLTGVKVLELAGIG